MSQIIFIGNPQQFQQSLWTPAEIPTVLWLDAADPATVTTISGAVSQWNDKSGNGINAVQATAANRPIYQAAARNGRNVVRFTGSSNHFLTAGTTSTFNFLHDGTNSAVYIVARIGSTGDNPNTSNVLLDNGGSSSSHAGYCLGYDDNSALARFDALQIAASRGAGGGYVTRSIDNNRITPGTYHIISNYIDTNNAVAANRSQSRIDGGIAFGSNIITTAPVTSNSSYVLNIGKQALTSSQFLTGDICETLILNYQPDTTTDQKIQGYLANKWA